MPEQRQYVACEALRTLPSRLTDRTLDGTRT